MRSSVVRLTSSTILLSRNDTDPGFIRCRMNGDHHEGYHSGMNGVEKVYVYRSGYIPRRLRRNRAQDTEQGPGLALGVIPIIMGKTFA